MTHREIYGKTINLDSDATTAYGGIQVTPVSSANVTNTFNGYAIATWTTGKGNQGSWSGGFVASADFAIERVGNSIRIFPGYTVAASGTNAVATFSVTLPVEFRPGTAGRGGPCAVYDAGTYKQGYFQVSTAGVLTVGISENSAGVLQPFTGGASSTGILDQVLSYSIF